MSRLQLERTVIKNEIKSGKLTQPDLDQLDEWQWDGGCEAACEFGCWVEPDGYCPHGRPSWFLVFGLI